jgi:hypothetical protein
MNRLPLAICYIRRLNEWRAVQTSQAARGHDYEAILVLRKASEEDLQVLYAGLVEPKIKLNDHLDDDVLSRWDIPSPFPREAPLTQKTVAGFSKVR